jgi:hypothetical protein
MRLRCVQTTFQPSNPTGKTLIRRLDAVLGQNRGLFWNRPVTGLIHGKTGEKGAFPKKINHLLPMNL